LADTTFRPAFNPPREARLKMATWSAVAMDVDLALIATPEETDMEIDSVVVDIGAPFRCN
jgi:hypothetical protein